MSVSYALRNRPEVSKKTSEHILRIAKKMGYTPDARMSSRMQSVRDTKERELLPIAYLNLDEGRDHYRHSKSFLPYFEGAKAQAERRGYMLEPFWLREPGMTQKRISQILYHRSIKGVIVAPPSHMGFAHLRLDWKHFAAVTFDKSLIAPRLHRVAQDHYYNTRLALKMLKRNGYQRIGVIVQAQADRRSYQAIQAALGLFQQGIPETNRIPPLFHIHADIAGEEFPTWFKQHRPDAIICQHSMVPTWIADLGLKVPDDIGVVHLALDGDCENWAGIHSRKHDIGATTVNTLISLMQSHELNLPSVPTDILIQGKWQWGDTLLSSGMRSQ